LTDDYKVQYSIKFPHPSADMVNVRANTVDELKTLMAEIALEAATLAVTADAIRTDVMEVAKQNIKAEFPTTTEVASGGQGQKLCAHGVPYTFRSGTSQKGKAYSGLFCTVKNDPNLKECEPIFNR
jgi:alpha-D-ribose 1-methylphosphonate 5-triphosphate diphosphatase PhnM